MFRRTALGFIASTLALTTAAYADVNEKFRTQKCVNMGNALDAPTEGEWGHIINLDHFEVIKEAGFDTVRIPVRWSAHTSEGPDYTIDETFFARVDEVLAAAIFADLQIVLNIHHFEEINEAPDEQTEKFIALWRQIGERYKNLPDSVYFEVLNEPNGALNGEKMRAMQRIGIETIRETNPTRVLMLGGEEWSSIRTIGSNAAIDDPNVMLTFHYYDPFDFTHQKAPWTGDAMPKKTRGWGNRKDRAQLKKDADLIAEVIKATGKPIFLGEFGAYDIIKDKERRKYLQGVASEMGRVGAPWCVWSFTKTFDIYDSDKQEWKKGYLEALGLPPQPKD